MKIAPRLALILLLSPAFIICCAQKTYTLIPKNTGKINKSVIDGLSPALKALAALYSGMGGTNCLDLQCELTTALGLGNQGSEAQKNLILKFFQGDKVATLVVSQDCYQPPVSAASFSNFVFLSFVVRGDEVQVNYELDVLNHGAIKKIQGPDVYSFKNQEFKNKKRVLYGWVSK